MRAPGLIPQMTEVVAEVLGEHDKASQVVQAILRRFGGGEIYLPAADYVERNRQILDLLKAGASVAVVARRFRLSIRTIYRIVGEM